MWFPSIYFVNKTWFAYAAALIFSIVYNFNKISFSSFVFSSAVFFGLLSVAMFFLFKMVHEKISLLRVCGFIAPIVILAIMFLSSLFFFYFPAETDPHFRTNILTRQCDFGGWSGSVSYNPWYYSLGCDLSEDDLVVIAKKSPELSRGMLTCEFACESDSRRGVNDMFCRGIGEFNWGSERGVSVSCHHFMECPAVSCVN